MPRSDRPLPVSSDIFPVGADPGGCRASSRAPVPAPPVGGPDGKRSTPRSVTGQHAFAEAVSGLVVGVTSSGPEREECPASRRVDGMHSFRFDGDGPYIICSFCGETRDAITGQRIR